MDHNQEDRTPPLARVVVCLPRPVEGMGVLDSASTGRKMVTS